MQIPKFFVLSMAAGSLLLAASAGAGEPGKMSFFVTSAGPGNGANLGGLAGADVHLDRLCHIRRLSVWSRQVAGHVAAQCTQVQQTA